MAEPFQNEEDTAAERRLTLGDHPALDLLNTVALVDGKLVDSLRNGSDVLQWLDNAGWRITHGPGPFVPPRLLKTTRSLREEIRALVEKRKAGKRLNLGNLNAFLARAESHLQIERLPNGALDLRQTWEQRTAEQVLGPLAEAAAKLLAEGDFSLVRRCEHYECVLWFYDRTRSHRRRWCSMATCGNRHKVEAFRTRQSRRSLSREASKTTRKAPKTPVKFRQVKPEN